MKCSQLPSGRRKCTILTCAVLFVLLSVRFVGFPKLWQLQTVENFTPALVIEKLSVSNVPVQDVLNKLVDGRWVERPYTPREIKSLQQFLDKSREKQGLPRTLQRKDNKCGNNQAQLTHKVRYGVIWFRALCDPFGSRPCCYNNQCTNKSVDECKCPNCHDMRQQIYSEFSDWVPSDPNYKMEYLTEPHTICQLLQGRTVIFYGDSLIRHLYTSVVSFVYGGDIKQMFRDNLDPGLAAECTDKYYLFSTACRMSIRYKVTVCDNNTELRYVSDIRDRFEGLTDEVIKNPKLLLLMSQGIHFHYQEKNHIKQLKAWLDGLPKSSLHRLAWVNYHCPGLLKTPRVPGQLEPSVLRYNSAINAFLRSYNITIFNFFNMTKGVMSHDGQHFSKGVNDLKAQIFFRYLKQIK